MTWASCLSPNRILNKPGTLTEDEFAVIKTHAQVGAQVLRAIPDSERVAQAVESHHEAFDGSGYPFGLKGENIPLYGRIIAVADAYVNMTSDRSFRSSENRRAGDCGTGKAERDPLRWHDRPFARAPAQDGSRCAH